MIEPSILIPGKTQNNRAPNLDRERWRLSHDGLIIPRKARPVAIDLFAGAGGFSLGLMQQGFEVITALEYDASAAITYMFNLGSYPIDIHFGSAADKERMEQALQKGMKYIDGKVARPVVSGGSGYWQRSGMVPVRHFFFGDIRSFTGEQILKAIGMKRGEVDVVVGGPPCQGFSRAGKQNVMDPRNSLVFEFARMVLEIYPKSMVMENVPDIVNMVTPEGIPVVDALCRILEDGNFGAVDLLKRSLLTNTGSGAMLRGKKPSEDGGKEKPDKKSNKSQAEGQLELL